MVAWRLEAFPAVCRRANIEAQTAIYAYGQIRMINESNSTNCMSLDCSRKPEMIHINMSRTWKLYVERPDGGFRHTIFMLSGSSANQPRVIT